MQLEIFHQGEKITDYEYDYEFHFHWLYESEQFVWSERDLSVPHHHLLAIDDHHQKKSKGMR